MNHVLARIVMLALAMLVIVGCANEQDIHVIVSEGGATQITTRMVMERSRIEQMMQMYDRQPDFGGDWDEEGEDEKEAQLAAPPDPAPVAEPKPQESATPEQANAELERKIRSAFSQKNPLTHLPNADAKISSVAVGEKTVEMVYTVDTKTLKDFVSIVPHVLDDAGLGSLRVEMTESGQVKFTFGATEMPWAAQKQQMTQMLKASKFKGSFKLTFPGKIVSSTLPTTEDKSTSVAINAEDTASLDQMFSLMGKDLVIEVEPTGLPVDALPLDSAELEVTFDPSEPDIAADMPIEEGAEGFIAEALGVTQTLVHRFDEGTKLLGEQARMMLEMEPSQCVVQARLFPQRGRRILSVSQGRVISAVDDQGRGIEGESVEGEQHQMMMMSTDEEEDESAQLTVTLALPQSDAQAIEKIDIEAVAVTMGEWKRHVVDDLKPAPDAPIDLGELLPGATLTVRKVKRPKQDEDSMNNSQGAVQIEIAGPKEIAWFTAGFEGPGGDSAQMHSYTQNDQTQPDGDKFVRRLTVQYNLWSHEAGPVGNPTFVVRFPQDLKRQKVVTSLDAVDLF